MKYGVVGMGFESASSVANWRIAALRWVKADVVSKRDNAGQPSSSSIMIITRQVAALSAGFSAAKGLPR